VKTIVSVRLPAANARLQWRRAARDIAVSTIFLVVLWVLATHWLVHGRPSMPSSTFDSPGLEEMILHSAAS
jgi:hypothetical protein